MIRKKKRLFKNFNQIWWLIFQFWEIFCWLLLFVKSMLLSNTGNAWKDFFSLFTFMNAVSFIIIISSNWMWNKICIATLSLYSNNNASHSKKFVIKNWEKNIWKKHRRDKKTHTQRNTHTHTHTSEHVVYTGRTTAFLLLTSCGSQYVVRRVLFSWSLVWLFFLVENSAELHHSLIVCRTRFKPLD